MRLSRLRTDAVAVAVLAATAPFLLLAARAPRALSLLALGLLVVPFVLRRAQTGRLSRPTLLNKPVAALALVGLPAALLLSPAPWAVTWPRVCGLAWAIALFFAVADARPPSVHAARLTGATWLFLGLGGVLALLAPLLMRRVDKLFILPQTGWLAARLGWSGLAPNEVAGVLTLFLPLAVALACGALWRRRWRPFAALLVLAVLLLVALLLTQSRTGLVASATGALLAVLVGARPRWRWLGASLGAVGLAALAAALSPLGKRFVFAGANSWQSVVGPRLGIWGQAIDGIRDHPIWGMGLGAFGRLAHHVYPVIPPAQAVGIEDAHNLYLQTALDFGLLGGLGLLAVLAVAAAAALGLARGQPPRSLPRLWAAGLLGALAAHALYSLTDAVALGTPGGAALWVVLGLIMAATPATATRVTRPMPLRAALPGSAVAVVMLVALLGVALPVNRAGQLAARALLNPAASAGVANAITPLTATRCRAGWYEGLLQGAAGDETRRAAVWGDLLACSPDYIGYMAVLAPSDAALARRAVALHPAAPAGHFWLAALLTPTAPDEAIAAYRRGLSLAPGDGRRWLDLANLLAGRDDPAALDAFLQACHHGDPGANGCARAASIVAAQGDLETAISYYRLSNWSVAREAAEELERELAGE